MRESHDVGKSAYPLFHLLGCLFIEGQKQQFVRVDPAVLLQEQCTTDQSGRFAATRRAITCTLPSTAPIAAACSASGLSSKTPSPKTVHN